MVNVTKLIVTYYQQKKTYKLGIHKMMDRKIKTTRNPLKKLYLQIAKRMARGYTTGGEVFIYIKYDNDAKLLAHEVGHIIGLTHTWRPVVMNPSGLFRFKTEEVLATFTTKNVFDKTEFDHESREPVQVIAFDVTYNQDLIVTK